MRKDIVMGLKRIRRAIRDGRYEFTVHALEEMDEDGLDESDIRYGILHGGICAELTEDPRGIRFVVLGKTHDETRSLKLFAGFCRPICCV